eukprot:COSAG01_NODE_17922_length_1114_cov_1.221675_1_plen_165_part_10
MCISNPTHPKLVTPVPAALPTAPFGARPTPESPPDAPEFGHVLPPAAIPPQQHSVGGVSRTRTPPRSMGPRVPHAHKAQNAFDRSRCGAGQGGAVVHCSRAHHPVHVSDVLASDQARQLCTASFQDVVHSPTQLQREPATSYAVSHGDQTKDIWHTRRSGCMYAP